MLEAIGSGLAALLTPQAILFMFIGVIYGLVIGILPGLGGLGVESVLEHDVALQKRAPNIVSGGDASTGQESVALRLRPSFEGRLSRRPPQDEA